MRRFGGPGRPPKVKETPVGPIVPVAAAPPPDSDDASSTTSEPMMMNNKGDSTVIISNNNNNTNSNNNNKAMSTSSDVVVDHSYTAPQWLLQEKQTAKFFSVPIPPVSPEMFEAVQRLMGNHPHHNRGGGSGGGGGDGSNTTTNSNSSLAAARVQTHHVLEKLQQLRRDHKTQSKRVLNHKEKLANAIARKNQGMEELRRKNQIELNESLQQLEVQVRSEELAKFEQQQEQLKQEIQQQFEHEYETEQSNTLKKRKLESLDTTTDQDKDNTDSEKNAVAAETATATTTESEMMEEGEEVEPEEPQPKQVKTESPKKELVSQHIQTKIDTCQAKLDSLQEKKSEMVWLLKQVIKADAKRKAEQLKLQKATTAAPAAGPGTTPGAATLSTTSIAQQHHES